VTKKLTEAVQKRIFELYNDGLNNKEIAVKVDVSVAAIDQFLRAENLMSNYLVKINKNKKDVCEMYRNGHTLDEMVETLNLSRSTVYNYLKDKGLFKDADRKINRFKHEVICGFCAKKFYTPRMTTRFCSNICSRRLKNNQQHSYDRICVWCDKTFTFSYSHSTSHPLEITCSTECNEDYARYHQGGKRYNIHPREYKRLINSQCMVCGSKENLCIDHNHDCCSTRAKSCGKCVRGVLCGSCNSSEGLLKTAENAYNLSTYMQPKIDLIGMLKEREL